MIFDVTTIPVLEHHKLRPYTITNLINKHCLCSECSTDHPFPISLPRLEKVKELLSCVQFFATPWTTACQGPLSMEFSRQEYWSGLLFPSPGDLSNPGTEPRSPALQADSLLFEPPGKPLPLPGSLYSLRHTILKLSQLITLQSPLSGLVKRILTCLSF